MSKPSLTENTPRTSFIASAPCGETPSQAVLRFEGDLDLETMITFRDAAFSAIGARPSVLLLDLTDAPFVDTTGLETLVTVARVGRMVAVSVRILPSPHLRHVLRVTGLTRFLPIAESVEGATPPRTE